MGLVEIVAGVVVALGSLTFIAMMAWSIRLTYVVYAQWQLIGPETEQELRGQAMPYFEGLTDPWWQQIAPFTPYERIAQELVTKTVRTDNVLANAVPTLPANAANRYGGLLLRARRDGRAGD